jgi:hypothetical protein
MTRKLSTAQDASIRFIGSGNTWDCGSKVTLNSLVKRGLIFLDTENDRNRWTMTLAGWEYLWEVHGTRRPWDPFRLSVSDAWEQVVVSADGTMHVDPAAPRFPGE